MKQKFSKKWVKSKQPRKQRKYRHNAPLHIKSKFMRSNLSKELRKKYGIRNISLRKGDKVKVMRGQFRKKTGLVSRIDLKKERVFVESVYSIKRDGTKPLYPLNASNLMIIELEIGDKKRKKVLERIKK
jgi:large subunit ribosomal protein L24